MGALFGRRPDAIASIASASYVPAARASISGKYIAHAT